jgi:predicted phage-related endonuclease
MGNKTDRHLGLGGTDAMRIMSGDWFRLYQEKMQLTEPANLDDIFEVQLGIYTEPFHRQWFQKLTGFKVEEHEGRYLSKYYGNMYAHIDGWIEDKKTFVELKHSNAFFSLKDRIKYYMPQLHHYMYVMDVKTCYFSAIFGNSAPQYAVVGRDSGYMSELIRMEEAFWWHVEHKTAPEDLPSPQIEALAKMAENATIDGYRTVDMSQSNSWISHSQDFLRSKDAYDLHEKSKEELKSLVGDDVGEAYGNGVVIKRNKKGHLQVRIKGEDK